MYGLFKKVVTNKSCIQKWDSLVEEAMDEIKGEEGIGIEALEGQYFQYMQELNQLFQAIFFNWIGKGGVQPRTYMPPFQPHHVPTIPVPPNVSLQHEVPENDRWQDIVHPTVSHHRG